MGVVGCLCIYGGLSTTIECNDDDASSGTTSVSNFDMVCGSNAGVCTCNEVILESSLGLGSCSCSGIVTELRYIGTWL